MPLWPLRYWSSCWMPRWVLWCHLAMENVLGKLGRPNRSSSWMQTLAVVSISCIRRTRIVGSYRIKHCNIKAGCGTDICNEESDGEGMYTWMFRNKSPRGSDSNCWRFTLGPSCPALLCSDVTWLTCVDVCFFPIWNDKCTNSSSPWQLKSWEQQSQTNYLAMGASCIRLATLGPDCGTRMTAQKQNQETELERQPSLKSLIPSIPDLGLLVSTTLW